MTDALAAARRRVANALHEMHPNQQVWISPELASEIDAAWSAYDAAVLAANPDAAARLKAAADRATPREQP